MTHTEGRIKNILDPEFSGPFHRLKAWTNFKVVLSVVFSTELEYHKITKEIW